MYAHKDLVRVILLFCHGFHPMLKEVFCFVLKAVGVLMEYREAYARHQVHAHSAIDLTTRNIIFVVMCVTSNMISG